MKPSAVAVVGSRSGYSAELFRAVRRLVAGVLGADVPLVTGDADGVDTLVWLAACSWAGAGAKSPVRVVRCRWRENPADRTRRLVAGLPRGAVLVAFPVAARSPGTWLAVREALRRDLRVLVWCAGVGFRSVPRPSLSLFSRV
ncbi:MAG: hypothetical protein KIPDCIKN_04339 [Haliscomenobacter sp.]|nr:hypothetical protein [Haliscomenobacter sp.]